ncbi:MAG: histidine phosphatase family protein [Candidatus Woesearchaeota archaeon]|nr:MAG: histidine phosphatase family protein [Candidatus Woesearchaeota archaeon]
MLLIITRHGETEENRNNIIQGHLPGTLSGEGISQAKKVALRLKTEKIDYIYASDLARAVDTAKEIAKYHPSTPLQFVEELREKNLGKWQGKERSELEAAKKQVGEGGLETVETPKEIFARAEKFLHAVLSKHLHDTVLFVGHYGINKALIAAITGKGPQDIQGIEKPRNTSLSIFEIGEEKDHTIHLFNCVKHLE